MANTLFNDTSLASAVLLYLHETAPVLVLRLDSENRVAAANPQARGLFGDEIIGRPLADIVIHYPTGVSDLPQLVFGCETVSRVTFSTVSGMPETLHFRFFPLSDGALALGSPDLAEQQNMLGQLGKLNGDLHDLARQLQQANAELRQSNDAKTRYAQEMQEYTEYLRQHDLASLNLIEDAVDARERAEQANQALRESEEQFRSLVEGAPDAIFVHTESVFRYLNDTACRLFGAESPEQLLGRPVLDFIHPSSLEFVRERIQKLSEKEASPVAEVIWLRLDGSTTRVDVTALPFTYRGRDGGLVFARDITERRTAADALRRSEQRYRTILEAAPDANVVVNGAGVMVLVNTRTERMFGHPREALLGRSVNMLWPHRFRQERWGPHAMLVADPEEQIGAPIDLFGLRADGTEFPIEVNSSPLETEEGPLVFSAIRDVTERNRVEQRSRQLEIAVAEAEAANKAKSLFLSTMSHEIRTPMNAILGYSQLVLRDPNLGSDSRAHLKVINRSGEHLLDIINHILDMAKIEAGRLQLTEEPFDIRIMVRDLEAMFRLRAEAKALQFDAHITGEPLPQIVADEGKINQVLINLLGNAVKFTERGRVTLRVQLHRDTGNRLRLSAQVEDTGVGMTQEEQRELFQPFAQGRSGQRIQHGGTGLGLAISKGIANLMGGDITMSSPAGNGSIFRFEIPVTAGSSQAVNCPSAAIHGLVIGIAPGRQAPRILIADDVYDNRDWLTKLLSGIGFSVRSVENGEAALLAWEEWRPDLILMDMHMPGIGGLETTRRIRARPEGSNTVIIALTADAMETHRRVVLENDLNDFITKPCTEMNLLETLRTHLGLDYIYQEEFLGAETKTGVTTASAELSADQLKNIPADLVMQIRAATLNGNKVLLDKLILTIEQRGDTLAARALREMADKYEYLALIKLLEAACP